MADYVALYGTFGTDSKGYIELVDEVLPVVTHSQNGIAMVYGKTGVLVEAPTLPHFIRVKPTSLKLHVSGTFGVGDITGE